MQKRSHGSQRLAKLGQEAFPIGTRQRTPQTVILVAQSSRRDRWTNQLGQQLVRQLWNAGAERSDRQRKPHK